MRYPSKKTQQNRWYLYYRQRSPSSICQSEDVLRKHLQTTSTLKKTLPPTLQPSTGKLDIYLTQDLIDLGATDTPAPDEMSTRICRVTLSPVCSPATAPETKRVISTTNYVTNQTLQMIDQYVEHFQKEGSWGPCGTVRRRGRTCPYVKQHFCLYCCKCQ